MIRQLIDTQDVEFPSRGVSPSEIIGRSDAMQRVEREALLASRLNSNVILTGERGVGKTLVARFIHEHSDRSPLGFGTIDCEGLPDALFQSALFGCLSERVDGVSRYKLGLVESAAGGTILLKHIDRLSPKMQARLLWFFETGEYLRIGDSDIKTHHPSRPDLNVRFMASTTVDLNARVAAGEFLSSLYQRLNLTALFVPALRNRREDIPALVQHFAGRFAGHREVEALVRDVFCRAEWPGNVQEIKSLVIRQWLFSGTGTASRADVQQAPRLRLVNS